MIRLFIHCVGIFTFSVLFHPISGFCDPELLPTTAKELKILAEDSSSKVTVLNLWATWCPPCVEEFPYFVHLQEQKKNEGVRVIFVSADFEKELAQVKIFLKAHGVSWKSYWKSENDQSFIAGLHSEWDGALPATFIFDSKGELKSWWSGKVSFEELEQKVNALL